MRLLRAELIRLLRMPGLLVLLIAFVVTASLVPVYGAVASAAAAADVTDDFITAPASWATILEKDKLVAEAAIAENNSPVKKDALKAALRDVEEQLAILRFLIDERVPLYKTRSYDENSATNDYYLKGYSLKSRIFVRSFNFYSYIDPVTGELVEVFTQEYSYFAAGIYGDPRAQTAVTDFIPVLFAVFAFLAVWMSVTREFFSGSAKLLLTRPVSRTKLYFVKCGSAGVLTAAGMLAALAVDLIVSCAGAGVGLVPLLIGAGSLVGGSLRVLLAFADAAVLSLGAIVMTTAVTAAVKKRLPALLLPPVCAAAFLLLPLALPNFAYLSYPALLLPARTFLLTGASALSLHAAGAAVSCLLITALWVIGGLYAFRAVSADSFSTGE